MSTELPFVEAQLDALTNTIWWTLDQKFGRVTRPLSPPTILSRLQQIWDSLFYRLSIATVVPYLLSLFDKCHRPGRMAVWLWGLCILGPWVYQIFVYSWFIDPLRRLPGPKGHWLFGLDFGVPNEDLGFFQQHYVATLPSGDHPHGLFTYLALGCRRLIPFTPSSVSYFSTSRKYVKTEITRSVLRRLTGEGILVVDGAEHKRQRKILTPAFSASRVQNLIPHFWAKAVELSQYWERNAIEEKDGEGFEVFNGLTRTTLDIIGLAGFGYDFGALKDSTNPVAQAYFTIFDNSPETLLATLLMALYPILENLPFSWIKRSEDAKITITSAARDLIELNKRGEAGEERDILGCMVEENRRLEQVGEEGLSDEEMIYQILTFLGAGHETTSTALVWALYELSEHPEIQSRLRKEIHSVLGTTFDPTNPPTSDQLEQMKYLNNVVREVLRVDPPAPITARQATCDDIYEGIFIPKDTIIHFSKLVINMSPEIWGPDAMEFNPDRWDELKDVPPTQFFTFQHGPRSCIGRRFAETEMKVLLAVLIGTLEFRKVAGWRVEKYSLITMRPKNGLYLHIRKINSENDMDTGDIGVEKEIGGRKEGSQSWEQGAGVGVKDGKNGIGSQFEYGSWIDIGSAVRK